MILAAPNALKIPDPPQADSATVTGLGKWHFFWVYRDLSRNFEQLDDSKGAHVVCGSQVKDSKPNGGLRPLQIDQ